MELSEAVTAAWEHIRRQGIDVDAVHSVERVSRDVLPCTIQPQHHGDIWVVRFTWKSLEPTDEELRDPLLLRRSDIEIVGVTVDDVTGEVRGP
jgi:hypothetical protein